MKSLVRAQSFNDEGNYILINGCKYISISFPGAVGPGISNDNIIFGAFIHLHGGKLYGANTTGHILYDVLILPNGLKPSFAKPSRTLRES